MYELLVSSQFDFVHHLLKVRYTTLTSFHSTSVLACGVAVKLTAAHAHAHRTHALPHTHNSATTRLSQQKLRAENKLQSFLSAQQCKGPLFAFTKNTASDLNSKPAQKVLKLLFAAVKGPHDTTNDTHDTTRHDTQDQRHDQRHTRPTTRHKTNNTTNDTQDQRHDQRHDTR
jgi:hypothetical protein